MNKAYATLDFTKLQSKPSKIVSSKEALKEVEKINWSKDVLDGKKKVII